MVLCMLRQNDVLVVCVCVCPFAEWKHVMQLCNHICYHLKHLCKTRCRQRVVAHWDFPLKTASILVTSIELGSACLKCPWFSQR